MEKKLRSPSLSPFVGWFGKTKGVGRCLLTVNDFSTSVAAAAAADDDDDVMGLPAANGGEFYCCVWPLIIMVVRAWWTECLKSMPVAVQTGKKKIQLSGGKGDQYLSTKQIKLKFKWFHLLNNSSLPSSE